MNARWQKISSINDALNDIIYLMYEALQSDEQEPDNTSALKEYLPFLLRDVAREFKNAHFRIGGYFVHQSPRVKNLLTGDVCELGDLLIIYNEKHKSINYYNSLLLQAKRSCNNIKSNDSQYVLYNSWPKFKFSSKEILGGQNIDIYPKTVSPGAQYLIIHHSISTCCFFKFIVDYWCSQPILPLEKNISLAEELLDFLNFQTGRPFSDVHQQISTAKTDSSGSSSSQPGNNIVDEWSKMICGLIEYVAERKYTRKNMGITKDKRRKRSTIVDSLEGLLEDSIFVDSALKNSEDESQAISVLVIENDLSETELEKKND